MASPAQQVSSPPAPASPGPTCPNCGDKKVGLYCAQCGQKTPSYKDYSLWEQLKSWFVEDVIAYDGRIWGTLGALFLRPGKLTREYFDGRRAKYLGPLRIFVLANVALWFLSPYVGVHGFDMGRAQRYSLFGDFWLSMLNLRAELAHVTVAQMTTRIEAVSAAENQLAVLCLSPMLAVGIWIALARRGYRYVQHLIFAAHFFCVHIGILILTWALVAVPLYKYFAVHPEIAIGAWYMPTWKGSNTFQHAIVALPLFPYVYFAVKRAYALTSRQTVWRAIFVTCWACLVTRLFFDVAFALVLIFA